MTDLSAREIVLGSGASELVHWLGNEAIADLRPVAADFLAAVNETQLGVIRNRKAKDALRSVGQLPEAAKRFVVNYLFEHHHEEIAANMQARDIAYCRTILMPGKRVWMQHVTKRYESGVYVILPVSEFVIQAERTYFGPSRQNTDYWDGVRDEAERLGPIWPDVLCRLDRQL